MVFRSIEVWYKNTPFALLPADIRAMLTPEELEAYRGGTDYFTKRAGKCVYKPMRNFFRLLGKASLEMLHLYASDDPKYKAYFVFYLSEAERHVQVRLGSGSLPGDPPPGLSQVYQDVSGTIDGHELVGGWESAEEVETVAARRWQPNDAGGCQLDQSFLTYSFGNGDYAGYAGPERGFLYEHESGGRLEPFQLLQWAEKYFGSYEASFTVKKPKRR